MSTPVWYRGETREMVFSYVEDGYATSLTTATAVEYQVKAAPGDADPPLISLGLGSGVTLRTQSGATLGQVDIVVPSADTDALAPGVYYEEVVVVFPGTPPRRKVPVQRKIIMSGVVNRP